MKLRTLKAFACLAGSLALFATCNLSLDLLLVVMSGDFLVITRLACFLILICCMYCLIRSLTKLMRVVDAWE